MRECADLGIKRVWMHRSFGPGSVSDAATEYGRRQGITVIDGGCPLMFDPYRRRWAQGHAHRLYADRQGSEAGVTDPSV